jgi:GAF domain-containing protein
MDQLSESQRLQRLHDIGILDTPEDRLFTGLAKQALELVPGAVIAAISLVDSDRQWFKASIGLNVKETPRKYSFCSHTIETDGVMVVEDATQDSRFADNPLVTSYPSIRFYAGAKLVSGLGALCVIGQRPRKATEDEIAKLAKLAHCVDIQLMAHGVLFNLGATRAA